jgi:KDO2-lipid IV(A) lauroyltransferase
MGGRAQKLRKKLVRSLVSPLRVVSARQASAMLDRVGQMDHRLQPAAADPFRAALRRWQEALGTRWEIDALARQFAGNFYRWLSRDLVFDGRGDSEVLDLFRVEGLEHLEAARAEGRGVMLLTSHYGSQMVPAHWAMRRGHAVRMYMERPNSISRYLARGFDDASPLGQAKLFISRREVSAAESASSVMRAVQVLRAGMVLYLAGDVRWSGSSTVAGGFLGMRPSFTATWIQIAALSGAPIVRVYCRMEPGGGFAMRFDPPTHLDRRDARPERVADRVQEFLARVEDAVRDDPTNAIEYLSWVETDRMPGPTQRRDAA